MKRGVYRSLQRMTGNEVVLWDVVMELELIESIVTQPLAVLLLR